MLTSWPVILIVGTVLGFLSGLGIGGGSLLVIWLTVVLQTDPAVARGINLLFFVPSAVGACILRAKQNRLKLRPLLPAIIAGCIAAAVFSQVAAAMDVRILKKLFGGVLLAAGIRELLYRERNAK